MVAWGSVAWVQQAEVVTLLEQAIALTRELKGRHLDLARLCESTELPEDNEIGALLQHILAIRNALAEEAQLCPRGEAAEVRQLSLFPVRPACTPEAVGALKEKLAQQIRRLAALTSKENNQRILTVITHHDQAACRADLESLNRFRSRI